MSHADVAYSCSSCGYSLNLISSNRIVSGIGSRYRKSIKKGVISFHSIDLSRFTQVDEITCFPISWGHYRSKTKLLCRQCGVLIGYRYRESASLCNCNNAGSSTSSQKYFIKMHSLQPVEQS